MLSPWPDPAIDELLRLVAALQTSDANGVATPEGWQPSDQVMVPVPANMEGIDARMAEGGDCTNWYFCKKAL